MKKISTFLIGLIFTCSYSQIAIIKDKDGYTNVRKSSLKDTKIIYKLKENEAFWYNYDDYEEKKNWIQVFIPKDKFCVDYSEDMYLKGYIHKSRLLPIEYLKNSHQKEVQLHYEFKGFNRTNHIDDGNGYLVNKIDGRKIWGTDGNYPKREIKKANLIVNNTRINIHKVLYNDLYECNENIKVYKNKDSYFIKQQHGDGSGAYELIWVLTEKNGITQRLVQDISK
ncbi:hypothetical protein [Flavivirga algicola]|uniref:SH3b domain-containing protein n=1 Tax=Flavivirga algicola TaxID=2729136 RepID=A0ABX1S1T9_9FLAO|nr:hypothetical protein [Flavivirga algicola]NMH88510.1 hypothetical protein [Flavivirga algicola]